MKFNLTRFINLIKRDFITHKKQLLFTFLGLWGFLALIIFMNYITGDHGYKSSHFWIPIVMGMLFIGGLTFTALVFREFNTPGGRLQFLSLPASNFEKVFSRWIYSLILVPSFIIVSIWAASSFLLNDGGSIGQALGREGLTQLPLAYLLLHAVTFLLALYFNRLVPFKVMITGTVITLITGLISVAVFYLIFNDFFEHGIRHGPTVDVNLSRSARDFMEYRLLPIGIFILKFFLAPYLWIVSYFKMKEKQA